MQKNLYKTIIYNRVAALELKQSVHPYFISLVVSNVVFRF